MVLDGKKYRLWATRPKFSVMWSEGYCMYIVQNGCDSVNMVPSKDGNVDYIVSYPSFDAAIHKLGTDLRKRSEDFIADYPKLKRNLLISSKVLGLAARVLPFKSLLPFYKRYWHWYTVFQPYLIFPHYLEFEFEPEMLKRFPVNFDLISSTPRPFEHMKLNMGIFELPLRKIAKKYGWMSIYSATESPFDESYFENYKHTIDKSVVENSFREIEENNKRYAAFASELQKSDKADCSLLHEFAFIRTDKSDVFRKTALNIYPFIRRVAKHINQAFDLEEGSMLTDREVRAILSGSIPVTPEVLSQRGRRENVIVSYSLNKIDFSFDQKTVDRLQKEIEITGEVLELKGTVAQKGMAKGIVRKYLQGKTNWNSNESGYIFVAKHTMPQDIPYMKNAAGIVTDEGGITCHTAIVARELKIPCVIGARLATSILKEGDLVEVDAERGTVRIIK